MTSVILELYLNHDDAEKLDFLKEHDAFGKDMSYERYAELFLRKRISEEYIKKSKDKNTASSSMIS